MAKVDPAEISEHKKNFIQRFIRGYGRFGVRLIVRAKELNVGSDSFQFGRDTFRRQDEIHISRCNRAARHGAVLGRLLILRERDTPHGFDRL